MNAATERVFAEVLAGGQLGGDGDDFLIVEWRDAGDSGYEWIAPLHVHHRDDEAWYVTEGSLRFRIGDQQFDASAGGGAFAPKGTPHTYGNPSGKPARYLLVLTPRLRRLVQALHEPGAADYPAIFRAYESELLG